MFDFQKRQQRDVSLHYLFFRYASSEVRKQIIIVVCWDRNTYRNCYRVSVLLLSIILQMLQILHFRYNIKVTDIIKKEFGVDLTHRSEEDLAKKKLFLEGLAPKRSPAETLAILKENEEFLRQK